VDSVVCQKTGTAHGRLRIARTPSLPPARAFLGRDVTASRRFIVCAVNWRTKFTVPLTIGLATTLAVSFAVYGVVRAIG
jgi:hypothetical protein